MLSLLALLFAASSATVAPTTTPTSTVGVSIFARETKSPPPPTPVAPNDGTFMTTEYITVEGATGEYYTRDPETIAIAIPTCIQTITPDANGHVPPGTCNAIWSYYPSFGAAAVFAILFAGLTVTHVWLAAKYEKGWCWVVIMASLWETLAFSFRAVSTRFQQNTTIFLVFQIFVLLAPLWVNAFDYIVLGRMVYFFLPSHKLFSIPASTLSTGFVLLDITSFVVQLVGGGMATPTASPQQQLKGVHIYMGGIGLQEFFIVIFVGLALKFQREMAHLSRSAAVHRTTKPWRPLLYTLYISLALITVRIIFRFAEFSGDPAHESRLITQEAWFYVFEAVPMFFALLSFIIIHPGGVINGPGSKMPGLVATVKIMRARGKGRELLEDTSGERELRDYRRVTS